MGFDSLRGCHMTPKELKRISIALNDGREYGAAKNLACLLRAHVSTIRRQLSGVVRIPGPVEVAVRLLLERVRSPVGPSGAVVPERPKK